MASAQNSGRGRSSTSDSTAPPQPAQSSAATRAAVPPPVRPKTAKLRQWLANRTRKRPCWLLEKLPAEIRVLIWTHVLGGHRIHIVADMYPKKKRRHHKVKNKKAEVEWSSRICDWPDLDLADHFRDSPYGIIPCDCMHTTPIGCSLLHTCKTIYAEAWPILYGANTFTMQAMPGTTMGLRIFRNVLAARGAENQENQGSDLDGALRGPRNSTRLQISRPPAVSAPAAGLLTRFDLLLMIHQTQSPFLQRHWPREWQIPPEDDQGLPTDDPYSSLWALLLYNHDPFYDQFDSVEGRSIGDDKRVFSPPTRGAGLGYPNVKHLRVTIPPPDLPPRPDNVRWAEVVAFRKVFFRPILEPPPGQTGTSASAPSALRQCDIVVPPNYAAWLGMAHGQVFAGSEEGQEGQDDGAADQQEHSPEGSNGCHRSQDPLEGVPANSPLAKHAVFRLWTSRADGPDYDIMRYKADETVGVEDVRETNRFILSSVG